MIITKALQYIIKIITLLYNTVVGLFSYRSIFGVWGLFATRKFAPAKKQHKYAVLVAARNEAAVVGNLIESIKLQDYPSHLVDVFVVADNCTDNTAEVARKNGAFCYERFDNEHRTKGFALQFLVENIKNDYGIDAYEGYFIFDADNLLKKDYISRMNDSFDAGEKIITSYRNTKNFDDNWIAASYGIHWLRTIRTEHRARSSFRLASRIQGTGFLFASEVIKDGWNYTGLTEDRAFCADAVVNGYRISYNNDAQFFDEQPVNLRIALRQRIRWSKGHLQAFAETGGKLFKHIFFTGKVKDPYHNKEQRKSIRFWKNLRFRFMSFDMLSVVFPFALFTVLKKFFIYVLNFILVTNSLKFFGIDLAPSFIQTFAKIFKITIVPSTVTYALAMLTLFTVLSGLGAYASGVFMAAYVFLTENKRIMKIKLYKKIWYCLTFPMFDFINKVTTLIALFSKVEWKPIPHNASVTINEVDEKI